MAIPQPLSYYTQTNWQTNMARLVGVTLKFFIRNMPEMWKVKIMGMNVTNQSDSHDGIKNQYCVALCHDCGRGFTCKELRKLLKYCLTTFSSSGSLRASFTCLAEFPPAPSRSMASKTFILAGDNNRLPYWELASACKVIKQA